MPYLFKKGGMVEETGAKEIPLAFSKENLKRLIRGLIDETLDYSHQDFANWCYQQYWPILVSDEPLETILKRLCVDEKTYEVIAEVDVEWDLYLVNSYNPGELSRMDLSKIKLPNDWLNDWLQQLNAEA